MHVIELSTWKLWRIDARSGFEWMAGAFTLDDEYLGNHDSGRAPPCIDKRPPTVGASRT